MASIVEDCGEYTSSCGYCKTDDVRSQTFVCRGMEAHRLTVHDYQALLDRWEGRAAPVSFPFLFMGFKYNLAFWLILLS
jgi:hypothetical protein